MKNNIHETIIIKKGMGFGDFPEDNFHGLWCGHGTEKGGGGEERGEEKEIVGERERDRELKEQEDSVVITGLRTKVREREDGVDEGEGGEREKTGRGDSGGTREER